MKRVTIFSILNMIVFTLLSQEPLFKFVDWNHYIQVDSNNQRISEYVFDEVDYIRRELTAVRIKEKWGYVNYKGEFQIPLQYKAANYFSNGIAYVSDGDHYYFIDETNNIISEKYDTIYGQGRFYVFRKHNLYGFLDSLASIIEEPKFDKVDGFYEGKISVKLEGKWMSWSEDKRLNFNDDDLYFYTPDLIPIYNEYCREEDREREWSKSCSFKQMMAVIYKNIKYPEEAKEKGIQGKVFLRFIINEKGEIIKKEILRGIDKTCNDEVLRITEYIKKWDQPASTVSGKPVKMVITLPISFYVD